MKRILFFMLLGQHAIIHVSAQTIETANNTSLSVVSDISLNQGKSIQIDGIPLLKFLPASTGNLMLGIGSGTANTVGRLNTYVGYQAGGNALADSNTFVGHQAGLSTTTGRSNTFFGANAGRGNISGSRNTFVGRNTGPLVNNGDDNVFLGYNAGQYNSGSQNTFLGKGAGVLALHTDTINNSTAIGFNAYVSASNSIILGHCANVGIGTSSPQSKLEVVSDQDDESGLRLSRLTSYSNKEKAANRFLTVNGKGDVELARYRIQINSTTEWADYVFSNSFQLKPLSEVHSYINQYKHLPGLPSAQEVVKEGIDVTVLNVKLVEKIEELTLYIIDLQKQVAQQQLQIKEIQAIRARK